MPADLDAVHGAGRQSRAGRRFSRRSLLQMAGMCGVGLPLTDVLQRWAAAGETGGSFGRAKQVIMLYLHGGHAQQETFDPKPEGPSAVRGEFGSISTSLPGVRFSELLPHTAALADRLAVVRSMSHENSNHVTASLSANTGHTHLPGTPQTDFPPTATDFPPFGAVIDSLRRGETDALRWVRIGPLMRRNNGTVLHGQLPGFLGTKHSHFAIDQDFLADDVQVKAIELADGLSPRRLQGRRGLLQQIDGERRLLDEVADTGRLSPFYERAFSLLSAPEVRAAFDLASEPRSLRETYGWTEFGQRCVLARRLVEANIPVVNVSYCHTPKGSWDTHGNHFEQMRESLAPTFDAAFHGLLRDLDNRGLLEETLVVVNAEFGRTPQINKKAGRDHWPWVYSLAVAGAGIRPGTIFGASDESAAYPADQPRSPGDFAATIYHLLGVPPETVIHDQLGRPHQLVIGEPIHEILS